jgi:uncharacterized cupin superfamily protein
LEIRVHSPLLPGVATVEWYRGPTGAFSAGFWTHEGGTIEVDHTEHEFCLLLAGKVRSPTRMGTWTCTGWGTGS